MVSSWTHFSRIDLGHRVDLFLYVHRIASLSQQPIVTVSCKTKRIEMEAGGAFVEERLGVQRNTEGSDGILASQNKLRLLEWSKIRPRNDHISM
jgi:hypothetical protein